MSTDLVVPDKNNIPSYILNPELAKKANEDAAAGIGTGAPPKVKLMGTKFVLVDGNGEETPFPASKLFIGPDENQYLTTIVLRAKKPLQKAWYLGKYDPNATEYKAPDCFSNDGEYPDPAALSKQSETCAACPHNAFGSGTDQNGNATKGKACADTKILAVYVPPFGIYSFRVPAASLKNFGLYVKQLSAQGIPLGTVKTMVGFDPTASFPVLTFKFGGFLTQENIVVLEQKAQSLEAEECIKGITVSATAKSPSLPPPEKAANSLAQQEVSGGLDLGLDTPPPAGKAASKKAAAKPQTPPPGKPAVMDPSDISDDDLINELGLDGI